jgi:hypothetical protein
MSVKATNFVRGLRGLTLTEKLVSMFLADHVHYHKDTAYPGMATLAEECGLKDRMTASRTIQRLSKLGVILTDGVSRGGRGKTTVYRFNYSLENCDPRVTVVQRNCDSTVSVSDTETETLTPETATLDTRNCDSDGPKLRLGSRTKGLKGEEKGEKGLKGEASLSLSKPHGQNKTSDLADEVVALAVTENGAASFSGRAKQEIQEVLQEYQPTQDELVKIVPGLVRLMNDFQLMTAGSSLAASLSGRILALRKSTKAAEDQEVDLAEANRIVDANLAKKKAIAEIEAEKRRAEEEWQAAHIDELFGPPAPRLAEVGVH